MMGREHISFGVATGLAACLVNLECFGSSLPAALGFASLTFLGSLVPDADHEYSTINRKFPLAKIVYYMFGKRGVFHDPVFWGIIAAVMVYMGVSTVWFGVIFGIAGHLLLDSFTYGGIPILAILRKKARGDDGRREAMFSFHMLPYGMRFKSKSGAAIAITWVLNVLAVAGTVIVLSLM